MFLLKKLDKVQMRPELLELSLEDFTLRFINNVTFEEN